VIDEKAQRELRFFYNWNITNLLVEFFMTSKISRNNTKLTFLLVLFAAASFTSCSYLSNSLLIKISDDSKCNLAQYSIELPEMTISFSSKQAAELKGKRRQGELFVEIPIAAAVANTFTYKIRAQYENCKEIASEPREVKRGYIIYEYIHENKIDYDVRSKSI
jgi:hypothetical protein